MIIVDKIRASIHNATNLPVYYQSIEQINAQLDNAHFPCAYLFLLERGRLTEDLREVVDIQVFFVQPTTFDFIAEDNERLIDDCKQLALTWLSHFGRDQYFRLNAVTTTDRVYEQFDVVLTGFAVGITLEELSRPCL